MCSQKSGTKNNSTLIASTARKSKYHFSLHSGNQDKNAFSSPTIIQQTSYGEACLGGCAALSMMKLSKYVLVQISTDSHKQMGLKSIQSYGWFTTYSTDYM